MSYVNASPRLPRLSATAIASLARLDPALAQAMQDYFRETEQILENHAHAINGSADQGVEELYILSADFNVGQTVTTIVWDQLAYRDESSDQFGYNPATGIYTVPEGASSAEFSIGADLDFNNPTVNNQIFVRLAGTAQLVSRVYPGSGLVVPKKGFGFIQNMGIPAIPVSPGEQFWVEAAISDEGAASGKMLAAQPSGDVYSYFYVRAFY